MVLRLQIRDRVACLASVLGSTAPMQLAKIAFVDVAPDLSSLAREEREAIMRCIKAADWITQIYLRQISPDNPKLYDQLRSRQDQEGRDLFKYLELNGGPWDQFNDDQPFIENAGVRPAGAGLYPPDLTEREWRTWLQAHPDDQRAFESQCTVISRHEGRLVPTPYNEAYSEFLRPAASELQGAARLLEPGPLKTFLQLRADALLSNEYWKSDLAWVDTDGRPFEVTLGPYEIYIDRLFGLKAAFEAFVGLPDREATEYLRSFARHATTFNESLADRFHYRPQGPAISLEVVKEVYRGGEAAFGSQFIAYNLPNDKQFQMLKGSKNVLSRTLMEAKFSKLGAPVAERVLNSEGLGQYTFQSRLLYVLAHELAHGLGPGVVESGGRGVGLNVLLRDLYSPIEEVKANALGAMFLEHLVEMRQLELDDIVGCMASELVAFLLDFRTGYTGAHSLASVIQYNCLRSNGCVRFNPGNGTFDVDAEGCFEAMRSLSDECLTIQSAGDYDEARRFVRRWNRAPLEVDGVLAAVADVPFEVHPVYRLERHLEQ